MSDAASEKGFNGRDDKYIWGILAILCNKDEPSFPDAACENRSNLSMLAGSIYVLLSVTSLFITATLAMLVVTISPIVSVRSTLALYITSLVFLLASLLIFELKLIELFEDPNSWAIFHESIHTSIAGFDRPTSLPASVRYNPSTRRLSRIMAWIAFASLFASFVFYALRVWRTSQSKRYLTSLNTVFVSRKSVLFNVPKSLTRNDINSIKSRTFSNN